MTTYLTISVGITSLLSLIFYRVEYIQLSLLFLIIAVALSIYALFTHRKELKAKKEPNSLGGLKLESYSTDENTRLVIKSIGTAQNGFINFNDIVNDTSLHLKTINKTLDWLVLNKLATEKKGRRGKVYELTPKGRNSFRSILNPNKKA